MVALKNDRSEYGRRLRHLVMDALRRTCFCFLCLGLAKSALDARLVASSLYTEASQI